MEGKRNFHCCIWRKGHESEMVTEERVCLTPVREERLTLQRIEEYLEYLSEKGRSSSSLESYRRILTGLYDYLSEEKLIGGGTGPQWKAYMERQGFSAATVDNRMSAWNSFMQYLGHREWQMGDFHRDKGNIQPELSRTE